MKIEFDIFNRESFRTLTFSLKVQKKAQVSIIYMKILSSLIENLLNIKTYTVIFGMQISHL
jgi:hypothetical protein